MIRYWDRAQVTFYQGALGMTHSGIVTHLRVEISLLISETLQKAMIDFHFTLTDLVAA